MVMTRRPDEIKKGLECCAQSKCGLGECSYYRLGGGSKCIPAMCADALTLIQQLQDDNAQQARCIENMTDKLNAMNDEVAKLQAERDAAVKDIPRACGFCEYYDADEDTCGYQGCCFPVSGVNTAWQWRGVTKEE